jgi:p24 family protein beta-1
LYTQAIIMLPLPFPTTLLVALLVGILLVVPSAFAMSTKIDAATSWCFTEPVARDVTATFQFAVTHGGKLDINAQIYDESHRLLDSWTLATTGKYVAKGDASNNKFKVCFDNSMARFTPKWVSFSFHHGPHPAAAKVEHLDPIEKQIETLAARIDDLQNTQLRLRESEKNHRATIEDSNERVLLWAVFETVALFGMGIFQIIFLKRFLERKTSV